MHPKMCCCLLCFIASFFVSSTKLRLHDVYRKVFEANLMGVWPLSVTTLVARLNSSLKACNRV